ncbi:hypothetical protein C8R43DRAFT_675320 [Mycena crocata]|nr:hypothetical protein C8R43DRAFT_675320 [Mycena crocata]
MSSALSSPFLGFLSSGSRPAEADIPTIREILANADSRIATLDDEISAVQSTLERLVSQRDEAFEFALAHRVILSPHQYYPAEILCEIFRLTVEMTADPWLLGKICRRWRSISVDFPPIWSSISIDMKPMYDSPGCQVWPPIQVETHLDRSAQCPLKVAFRDVRTLDRGGQFERLRNIVNSLIVGGSERWETADWHLFPEHHQFLNAARGRVSALTTLTLHGFFQNSNVVPHALNAFIIAPSLRRLTLNGNLAAIVTHAFLPWSQITDYAADSDYNRDHFPLLALLTNVTEARLTLENTVPTTHVAPQRNNSLRKLYVNRGCILDLDLPWLAELTFEPLDAEPHEEDPLWNLVTFLTTAPALTKLCLIGVGFSARLLIEVLQQTSDLVDLCIQCRHVSSGIELEDLDPVVEFLHVGAGALQLPALRTLTFGGYGFAAPDKLVDMVEARWRAASPLTSFGMITRHSLGMREQLARLEILRKEGLHVLLVEGEDAADALFSLPFFEIAYSLANKDYAQWHWEYAVGI